MKPLELFAAASGEGGDCVVLVHAIGMDHRMWDDLTPFLARQFRVLRVDVRGHGKSPVPPRPYSLASLAGDVAAVLDRHAIAKAHLVGLSLGGMIGQAFALEHAQRLGRLVLANTTSSYGPEGRSMWQARAKAVEAGGLAAIKDMVLNRYFSDPFREENRRVVEETGRRFLETPAQGYLGCCDAIAELDYAADLPRIHARTLVVAGEKDVGTPPSMSEAIAARIPGSRLAVIAGAAHLSAVEKPGEFNALVRNFLASP